jgi:NAD(P)-dependent dehydrogenase (short-subunit alcohol dehydrogenase family)
MADVALICGAGGALGRALVGAFLARGDDVVAVGRSVERGAEQRVRREQVDLTEPDAVEDLWDRLAADGTTPRWVVNAAGGYRGGTVAASEPEEHARVLDLNLQTAWWSCRAAARRLDDGAAIVNVSSRSGREGGGGAASYSVAKAAVIRLSEVLAAELAPRVRVNCVLPSVIDTPQNRASLSPERIAKAVPPATIAATIAFLCSDAAAATSGAAIPVYGRA